MQPHLRLGLHPTMRGNLIVHADALFTVNQLVQYASVVDY